jgi:hypothetical protein
MRAILSIDMDRGSAYWQGPEMHGTAEMVTSWHPAASRPWHALTQQSLGMRSVGVQIAVAGLSSMMT